MNPRLAFAILAAGLIILGLYLSYPNWSSWFGTSPLATTTPQGIDHPSVAPLHMDEHKQYYDITGEYPPLTPLPGPANVKAIATMKAFIADAASEFKKDANLDALTPQDIQMQGLDQGRKYALDMTYAVHSSPATVSYVYTIYADTLGAHPNGYFRTFTFDMKTGLELKLEDIFASDSDYLGKLSATSRTELRTALAELEGVSEAEVDADMLNAGTTADPLNFANFYFDGSDFVLLFPSYQVAPYVAGPQTLRLPKAELAALLKSQYR